MTHISLEYLQKYATMEAYTKAGRHKGKGVSVQNGTTGLVYTKFENESLNTKQEDDDDISSIGSLSEDNEDF